MPGFSPTLDPAPLPTAAARADQAAEFFHSTVTGGRIRICRQLSILQVGFRPMNSQHEFPEERPNAVIIMAILPHQSAKLSTFTDDQLLHDKLFCSAKISMK